MAGEANGGTASGWMVAQLEGAVPEQTPGPLGVEVGIADDHAPPDFPPFDPTFFASQLLWLLITFGAFYLLMSRVLLPRIGGILEDRRDRIARDLDQADRLKQQSDDAITSYERALAEARARAFKIAAEAREAAKGEAAKRQAETESELDGMLAAAEARIGAIKDKALADVEEIAASAAEAVVERLIGKAPSTAELAKAVAGARGGAANA
jgi:F-type H+-transporting ATPase subunit b